MIIGVVSYGYNCVVFEKELIDNFFYDFDVDDCGDGKVMITVRCENKEGELLSKLLTDISNRFVIQKN